MVRRVGETKGSGGGGGGGVVGGWVCGWVEGWGELGVVGYTMERNTSREGAVISSSGRLFQWQLFGGKRSIMRFY